MDGSTKRKQSQSTEFNINDLFGTYVLYLGEGLSNLTRYLKVRLVGMMMSVPIIPGLSDTIALSHPAQGPSFVWRPLCDC